MSLTLEVLATAAFLLSFYFALTGNYAQASYNIGLAAVMLIQARL